MDIETKYDIDDKVYALWNNVLVESKIISIQVNVKKNYLPDIKYTTDYEYDVSSDYSQKLCLLEEKFHLTKEEALKSIETKSTIQKVDPSRKDSSF